MKQLHIDHGATILVSIQRQRATRFHRAAADRIALAAITAQRSYRPHYPAD
jgi:hypothetical protein